MHLSSLHLYPVKSLRGCSVTEASIDKLGIVGDRRFLVVDESGKFITQRTLPRMALVETALQGGQLELRLPENPPVQVPVASNPEAPLIRCEVWSSNGMLAEDCGDEVAEALSSFLAVSCRLVRIGSAFSRPMPEKKIPEALRGTGSHLVSFADAFPFLVISEASLADLNSRLVAAQHSPVPMDRFRPNLVVRGATPYAEDEWKRFRIGELIFHAGGPCARCVMVTTDQLTAERNNAPLTTLATYRRDPLKPSDVNFGQNLIHEGKKGMLRVGDFLTLLD